MGNIAEAVNSGVKSVFYADLKASEFHRQVSRSALADALHQAGDFTDAEKWFLEAAAIEQRRRPGRPQLSSMQGYAYCDFLFTKGALREIEAHARQTRQWADKDQALLALALDDLTLGRVHLRLALQRGAPSDLSEADREINRGVIGLRQAGSESRLPCGLITRAELRSAQGDPKAARIDLEEALEIATRAGLLLQKADCHVSFARVQIAAGETTLARRSLASASRLAKQTGYGKCDLEIARLQSVLE
jgi:tetratricopeptide (TPR) repeat protein